jgi:hypothetical protein
MNGLLLALVASQFGQPSGPVVTPVINGIAVSTSNSAVVSGLFWGDVDLVYDVGAVSGGGSIVFTVASTDPLNPATTIGVSNASPSISGAGGAGAVVLHAGHSSAVKVTWTITGTFSATIWASVQGIFPSEIQGIDGGILVTVSTGGGGGGGGSSWDAGVIVQSVPPTIFSTDLSSYVCCSSTPTPIPYSSNCFTAINFGPNAVTIYADGGSVLGASAMLSGTANPTVTPGGDTSACSSGVPYLCVSSVTSQTDGGCTAINSYQ